MRDRSSRIVSRLARLALPVCMTVGVLLAFAVVVAWFPKGPAAWRYPLHQIDAPAHYYFIRRILTEGVGAAAHLWPNDAYYPPLFHLLAAGLVALSRLFGEGMTIYAAFNIVWIAGAGLVWPAGMQLLASYWTCRGLRDARDRRGSGGAPIVFPCAMALIVPLLSVASASHPFQMLASGPLVAYGLSFSILPFWLYATLRLFDAIADRIASGRAASVAVVGRASDAAIVHWAVLTVLTGLLTVFAHPRMVFTWLLFIGPFLLMRLPWRFILAAFAACVLGAGAFFAYMVTHYKSNRYFNPGDWFHTFKPNRTIPDALRVFVTDNIAGPAGVVMAVMVVVSIVVVIAAIIGPFVIGRLAAAGMDADGDAGESARVDVADKAVELDGAGGGPVDGRDAVRATSAPSCSRPAPPHALRKDAVSVLLVTFLFALLYVCSTALTGWFPNIVAAAWYRAETRPLTMIPLAVVTLLVFAASTLHESAGRRMEERESDASASVGSDVPADTVASVGSSASVGSVLSTDMSAALAGPADSINPTNPIGPSGSAASTTASHPSSVRRLPRSRTVSAVMVVALAVLAIGAQFGGVFYEPDGPLVGWGNSTREKLASDVYANMTLTDDQPDEQLTLTKYGILADVARTVEPGAAVVSDPLNGSMYGMAAFGVNMLYPIYNPMAEKHGAIFGAVERAFDSGDRNALLGTVCPIVPDKPEYFLVMGDQAPSLKMFTFRQQYDPFHREDLIAKYVADGTLVKVRDYSDRADYARGWALYRFGCAG